MSPYITNISTTLDIFTTASIFKFYIKVNVMEPHTLFKLIVQMHKYGILLEFLMPLQQIQVVHNFLLFLIHHNISHLTTFTHVCTNLHLPPNQTSKHPCNLIGEEVKNDDRKYQYMHYYPGKYRVYWI